MAEEGRAYAALVTVQVLFGAYPIAAQMAFAHLPPLALAAVRTLGAAVVLALLYPLFARRPVDWRREKWRLVGLALIGVVLNQALFIVGLSFTTPLHAVIMVTTIPVFTYAIAVAAGKERLGPRRAAGIALALAGALYLVGLSRFEATPRQALGDLMVMANSLCFAGFLVGSKPLNERAGSFGVTTAVLALGALVFLPVALLAGAPTALVHLEADGWWLLAFIVLGPTVTTYALNATALRRVAASTVAAFIYLQPVVTALLQWLVLAEPPSWRVVPAALLVFLGVWLVARRRPRVLEGSAVVE